MDIVSATRKQLEQGQSGLIANFHNLSIAYSQLIKKFNELEKAFNNETAKTAVFSALTSEFHKLKANLTDINQRLVRTETQCSSVVTSKFMLDTLNANVSKHDAELAKNNATVAVISAKLSSIDTDVTALIRNTSLERAVVTQLIQKIGKFCKR